MEENFDVTDFLLIGNSERVQEHVEREENLFFNILNFHCDLSTNSPSETKRILST